MNWNGNLIYMMLDGIGIEKKLIETNLIGIEKKRIETNLIGIEYKGLQ